MQILKTYNNRVYKSILCMVFVKIVELLYVKLNFKYP